LPSGPFHTKRWAGYFLAAGGIAMIVAGIWYAVESMEFLDTTARTEGTVIALKRERGSKGMALDLPVVRFTSPESGETVEFKSRFGIRPSPFAVGDPVEVAYDPSDPSRAKIDSFWTIWFLPILLALFGLACFAAGFHTLRITRKS
jgi:hypothetical protein